MENARRDLMHRIIDEKLELIPVMHQLTHYVHCDKMLKWLLANRITGHVLLDWLKIEHNDSVLSMVKMIIKKQDIVLNKDWIR